MWLTTTLTDETSLTVLLKIRSSGDTSATRASTLSKSAVGAVAMARFALDTEAALVVCLEDEAIETPLATRSLTADLDLDLGGLALLSVENR